MAKSWRNPGVRFTVQSTYRLQLIVKLKRRTVSAVTKAMQYEAVSHSSNQHVAQRPDESSDFYTVHLLELKRSNYVVVSTDSQYIGLRRYASSA